MTVTVHIATAKLRRGVMSVTGKPRRVGARVAAFACGLLVQCGDPIPRAPDSEPDPSHSQSDPQHHEDACVVAQGRGFEITLADVEALRYATVPAIERGAATRLALDVWRAEWIATGEIGKMPLSKRIEYQRALAVKEGSRWPALLSRASAELELRPGPCYVARSQAAGRPDPSNPPSQRTH